MQEIEKITRRRRKKKEFSINSPNKDYIFRSRAFRFRMCFFLITDRQRKK